MEWSPASILLSTKDSLTFLKRKKVSTHPLESLSDISTKHEYDPLQSSSSSSPPPSIKNKNSIDSSSLSETWSSNFKPVSNSRSLIIPKALSRFVDRIWREDKNKKSSFEITERLGEKEPKDKKSFSSSSSLCTLRENQLEFLRTELIAELHQLCHQGKKTEALSLLTHSGSLLSDFDEFYPSKFYYMSNVFYHFGKILYSTFLSFTPGLQMTFRRKDLDPRTKNEIQSWMTSCNTLTSSSSITYFYAAVSLYKAQQLVWEHDVFESFVKQMIHNTQNFEQRLIPYAYSYLLYSLQLSQYSFSESFIRDIGVILFQKIVHTYSGFLTKALASWLTRSLLFGLKTPNSIDSALSTLSFKDSDLLFEAMTSFASSNYLWTLVKEICESSKESIVVSQLSTLGSALSLKDSSEKHMFMNISVRSLLKLIISQETNNMLFMKSFTSWINLISQIQFLKREDIPLRALTYRLSQESEVETESCVFELLASLFSFSLNLLLEPLLFSFVLRFFDSLSYSSSSLKVNFCYSLLTLFAKRNCSSETEKYDETLSFSLLSLLRNSFKDESWKEVDYVETRSSELSYFLERFKMTSEDSGLRFMSEFREISCVFDSLTPKIIRYVHYLSCKSSRRFFSSSCLAFSYITIPSCASFDTQILLYFEAYFLSLQSHCYAQGNDFLTKLLTLVSSQERVSETNVVSLVRNLLSFFLVVPTESRQTPTILYESLLRALQCRQWSSPHVYSLLKLDFVKVFSFSIRAKYPYQLTQNASNDVLYGGSPSFRAPFIKLGSLLLEELCRNLTAQLCWPLTSTLLLYSNLEENSSLIALIYKIHRKFGERKLTREQLYLFSSLENKTIGINLQTFISRVKSDQE